MRDKRGENENPERLEIFERYQALLFSIAYSILEVRAEAEELVREARDNWLQGADSELATAKASLVANIALLSLERLRVIQQITERLKSCPFSASAGTTRCLPSASSPAHSVSKLALMSLDELAPADRSAFLLRKILKCRYSEIGQIVDKDELECRTMVSRARRSIAKNRSTINLLKSS